MADVRCDQETLSEEILSKEPRFDGALIRVEHWQVRLPNGNHALREVVVHPGAAAIVPVDASGMVTLVRQHRPAVGELTLEIPAGKFDRPDEESLLCAQRELKEETGLNAAHWQPLIDLNTTPGFCNEHIAIFLATGLSSGESDPDDDEFLRVERMPLEEAVAMVMRGELRDGKTALGLLMAHRLLHEMHQATI